MNALSSASIVQVEFVRMVTTTTTYYYCNAAAPITVSGMTFTALGDLLSISDIKRDIKATSSDLTLSLQGIDGVNVAIILGSNIKGSTIDIWRGFLDSDNKIILTPTTQFFKRYSGIISNVSISEDFNDELRTRVATCGVSCASFRSILENRVQGIKTTTKAWQFLYPGDTSMDRVPVIAATYFDFGAKPKSGSQAASRAIDSANAIDNLRKVVSGG